MTEERKSDDGAWFAPKRFGYGAGLPIAWQGWALLIGFVGLLAVLARLLAQSHPLVFIVVALVLAAGFIVITAQHTRGGWRWRNGERD